MRGVCVWSMYGHLGDQSRGNFVCLSSVSFLLELKAALFNIGPLQDEWQCLYFMRLTISCWPAELTKCTNNWEDQSFSRTHFQYFYNYSPRTILLLTIVACTTLVQVQCSNEKWGKWGRGVLAFGQVIFQEAVIYTVRRVFPVSVTLTFGKGGCIMLVSRPVWHYPEITMII